MKSLQVAGKAVLVMSLALPLIASRGAFAAPAPEATKDEAQKAPAPAQ